jgi:hypothetical protein
MQQDVEVEPGAEAAIELIDTEDVIRLALGDPVEVRRRFDHEWARGFEIADTAPDGYRLRRRSDGAVLPVCFPAGDVRRSSGL